MQDLALLAASDEVCRLESLTALARRHIHDQAISHSCRD